MKQRRELSAADQRELEEFLQRFSEARKKRPRMSDEEFMAETEVSDEQYKTGLVLPGVGHEWREIDE